MTEVISVTEWFRIPWIVDRGKKIIKILILCFMSLEVQFSYTYLTKKPTTGNNNWQNRKISFTDIFDVHLIDKGKL